MAKAKIKPHKKESIIKATLNNKATALDLVEDDCFVISLRHIDKQQGDKFHEWESSQILSAAMESLSGYCCRSLRSQIDGKKFTIYGGFPESGKTHYFHPQHIPEDAEWARIHVTGAQCIIGHVVKNTFYVVFLDGEHKFWISELKNT